MAGELLEILLLVVLFMPLVFGAVLLVRRSVISRSSGTSIGAIRTARAQRWRAGILALTTRSLEWYPVIGLTATPAYRWSRSSVELGGVEAGVTDAPWLVSAQPQLRVVHCEADPRREGPGDFSMILPLDSYMALRSWAESSPPVDRRYEF